LLDWESFAWGKDSTNPVVAATEAFSNDEELAASYLTAHAKPVQLVKDNPAESQELVVKHLTDVAGKEVNKDELAAAFKRLEVTTDVNEKVIQEMADISEEADYIPSDDIDGMVDLSILDGVAE